MELIKFYEDLCSTDGIFGKVAKSQAEDKSVGENVLQDLIKDADICKVVSGLYDKVAKYKAIKDDKDKDKTDEQYKKELSKAKSGLIQNVVFDCIPTVAQVALDIGNIKPIGNICKGTYRLFDAFTHYNKYT